MSSAESGPVFTARLRLLPSSDGGRQGPIFGEYRPDWNLGNTWLGDAMLNGGRVLIDGGLQIAPGAEGLVRLQPLLPEAWGLVRKGVIIAAHEGQRVVGHATILGFASRPAWFTPEAAAFVCEARQFTAFVNEPAARPISAHLSANRQRLVALYAAAVSLPLVVPPDGFEAGPKPEAPKALPSFEKFEGYWEVFDPYEEEAPVLGSLSDDVLDVYCDVVRGLNLWDRPGVPKEAALWEWRFSFDAHWGNHAVDALRALHRACG